MKKRSLAMVVAVLLFCSACQFSDVSDSKVTLTPTPTVTQVPTKETTPTITVIPESKEASISKTMTVATYPKVDGSTATLPLSEAVFMLATGESAEVATKEVVHTKTTNSYYRLYDKEVDLLIVYEPSEEIAKRMKEEPLNIKPIGLDALVFMANQANPVESLTMEQLVSIYSGKISNWSEVGGLNKELLAFQRPVGSGSQSLMQKLVMKDTEMVAGDNVFRYSTMSDILEGMLSYNGEDNTLGYSVFYYANNMYFEKDLKFMAVNGVLPSTQTIYDGSYALTNAFYAVIRTDEPENSNARKLFDWLTEEEGQQLVLDLGYVPVMMPSGATISDAKVEQKEVREVLATKPLEQGEYFIFVNPQNTQTDYYFGDMTVYNSNWEEIANFYNVTLDYQVSGIYKSRYLPIGQIRQNTEGEQDVTYGIFDLEAKQYSIYPTYKYLSILDVEKGYYGVPVSTGEEEEIVPKYQIIDGVGNILLPEVLYEDWLTISTFGNGYMEYFYDYKNWENGYTYRYYDENLQLKKVFCESAHMIPSDDERIEGVEYYLIDQDGCLVDENAEVLISKGLFLERYGVEDNMYCILPFNSVTMEESRNLFGILYQNMLYLVNRKLDLIEKIPYEGEENFLQGGQYFRDFQYYYDVRAQEYVYRTYEGEPLTMWDGNIPDEIDISWDKDQYVLYRRDGKQLLLEEHTTDGKYCYTYDLKEEDTVISVVYHGTHEFCVLEDSGETMQNPYSVSYQELPIWEMSFYHKDILVARRYGLYEYMTQLEDGHRLWVITTGDTITHESDSLYEEMDNVFTYNDYLLIKEDELLYEVEDAYMLMQGIHTIQFINGNYIYSVGWDGTPYVRALHTLMMQD